MCNVTIKEINCINFRVVTIIRAKSNLTAEETHLRIRDGLFGY